MCPGVFYDMKVLMTISSTVCRMSAAVSPSLFPLQPPHLLLVRAYVSVDGVTVFPIKLNCGQINEARVSVCERACKMSSSGPCEHAEN